MFILKFFASIFLFFFFIGLAFLLFSFLVAKNFLNDLDKSLKDKFDDTDKPTSFTDDSNIPSAIECPKCGTFYAEMPADKRCSSCGAKLD